LRKSLREAVASALKLDFTTIVSEAKSYALDTGARHGKEID
jgi:hypothetical protein